MKAWHILQYLRLLDQNWSWPTYINKHFFLQILSYIQNSSADWSVWNLRGKTIKTKEFYFQLKMRSVNFILIRNLCTVDLFGALFILPVPLIATIKGHWDFPDNFCAANSIVNVALWFQHIVMFAMLKIDRVLASCLPFGKYPLLNVEAVNGLILATWVFSFFVAALVTLTFKSNYEPAVVLCIPDLPIGFFITIFSVYCLVLCSMVVGYITVLVCLKKKQAQIQNTNMVQTKDYKGLEKAALTR